MRKQYSAALKAQIVREILKEEKSMGQIAAEHGIHPIQLSKWKGQALEGLPGVFEGHKRVVAEKAAHESKWKHSMPRLGA